MLPIQPNFGDSVLIFLGLVLTWVAGEAGRAALAGAAGGFINWLMTDKRRLRDGVIAIITGIIFAKYFSPFTEAILKNILSGNPTEIRDTAGFTAGLGGMSLAKIVMTVVESGAKKFSGGKSNET